MTAVAFVGDPKPPILLIFHPGEVKIIRHWELSIVTGNDAHVMVIPSDAPVTVSVLRRVPGKDSVPFLTQLDCVSLPPVAP